MTKIWRTPIQMKSVGTAVGEDASDVPALTNVLRSDAAAADA